MNADVFVYFIVGLSVLMLLAFSSVLVRGLWARYAERRAKIRAAWEARK